MSEDQSLVTQQPLTQIYAVAVHNNRKEPLILFRAKDGWVTLRDIAQRGISNFNPRPDPPGKKSAQANLDILIFNCALRDEVGVPSAYYNCLTDLFKFDSSLTEKSFTIAQLLETAENLVVEYAVEDHITGAVQNHTHTLPLRSVSPDN